ncbi:MAG TPA: radical SAM protein [Bacillota bacterium]|uniref:Radical SAM protein n=1 Tax=anaerobic digester metagenome TaxID=1263854 RepID=A0A485M8N8_9ZZZZ|nr:radical SAM protein [Bacillota bacterium]HPZ12428.1 radical SAM protein [Bacillota bacterium]
MRSVKQMVTTIAIKEGIRYLEKDPIGNYTMLVNWAERLAVLPEHKEMARNFRKFAESDNNWFRLITRVVQDVDTNIQKEFLVNFFVNSAIAGIPAKNKIAKKHGINIPWAILMDPTAACNLKCTGCWAAEYKKSDSLSNETLDRIIREGKQLGIYMYIYSGGEPLVRKHDLIKLAEKHDDCMFLSFTNGTLVDEAFCKELVRVGNLVLAISIEGSEEETDLRRGKGTYQKVIRAMDLLKAHRCGFGFSACYHSKNIDGVGSEEFVDLMIEKGCLFGWYFTYMPLGKDAVLELLVTPEQREFMYHQIRGFREKKDIFLIDFWNDGEFVDGCIAGGRNYLHINANGDVEPCAFIHYANTNIKEMSLLEALKSPLFAQYKQNQPFNRNHLRPCPLLDNPEQLKKMVHQAGAYPTQLGDLESVDDLTDKCQAVSKRWAKTANRLWAESHAGKKDRVS